MAKVIKIKDNTWILQQRHDTLNFAMNLAEKYYPLITGKELEKSPKLYRMGFFISRMQNEQTFVIQFEEFTLVVMETTAFVLEHPNTMFDCDMATTSLNWIDKPWLYEKETVLNQ